MQTRKKLYTAYGQKSLTERQCQNWFARFRSGDVDLKDASRSGRPTEVDDDKIKVMIENNWRSMTQGIAEKLKISHTYVERHLEQPGYVNKLDICVPHKGRSRISMVWVPPLGFDPYCEGKWLPFQDKFTPSINSKKFMSQKL